MTLTEKILEALADGKRIYAIGGAVYTSEWKYVCVTGDLYDIAREYGIVRVDSGGRPTWELASP